MLTVEDALTAISAGVTPLKCLTVPLAAAHGLTLGEAITSDSDSPPFDKSMMDGYAVRAEDCQGDCTLQVVGEVMAGQTTERKVDAGETIRIMTGAPLPTGADAVVPVELSQFDADENSVQLRNETPLPPGTNVVQQGCSMQIGEQVINMGVRLRAQEIALLAELGRHEVSVFPRVRVSVLATGDELVSINETPGAGQIRNSNALMLATQAAQAGAEVHNLGIARDTPDDLRTKISTGLSTDVLCLSGGVSAGKLDLVPTILTECGVQEVFHKVQMKPGKPLWFGIRPATPTQTACYVFGLPGNPVSSMVCFELFVRQALRCLSGQPSVPTLRPARLLVDVNYPSNRETYFPAQLSQRDAELCVTPVDWKGSFDLRSTLRAHASLKIPIGDTIWKAGTLMNVLPWGAETD